MTFLKGRVGVVTKRHMTFFREQFELGVSPFIDKIVEDALKTTDKTLQKKHIHDDFYRQEYWTGTEINLFVSFILQYTASMLWTKAQLAPSLQKMSA